MTTDRIITKPTTQSGSLASNEKNAKAPRLFSSQHNPAQTASKPVTPMRNNVGNNITLAKTVALYNSRSFLEENARCQKPYENEFRFLELIIEFNLQSKTFLKYIYFAVGMRATDNISIML